MEWPGVGRDEAVHGEALVETKRKGHGGLAGRRIVGGWRRAAQESMRGGPLLGLFDLPLHDGSHFTLPGSGIAEEW